MTGNQLLSHAKKKTSKLEGGHESKGFFQFKKGVREREKEKDVLPESTVLPSSDEISIQYCNSLFMNEIEISCY